MDSQSRSGVRPEKSQRDRLIRLCEGHPEWVLGKASEVWWSRFEQPTMRSWAHSGQPLRLVEQSVAKDDPDPKALACYGLLARLKEQSGSLEERMWLRFVEGRPVSGITTQFVDWCCRELDALGKEALLLVWDNASWHKSREVMRWIEGHNRSVKEAGRGVRILACLLPSKSPWLNPIEPRWVHGKRRVVEPDGTLTAEELEDRVYDCFGCDHHDHLTIAQEVA